MLWLDNAAGYYKLVVNAGDSRLIDVPASGDPREALQKISQSLPQEVRLPDLKPWGLNFRGARLVVAEGRPAAQLVYTTDNKAIGPLTLIIGVVESSPTSRRRSRAARMSTCCTGGTRAAPTRSSARPISAISGASPTTSPGSSTRSDHLPHVTKPRYDDRDFRFAQVKEDHHLGVGWVERKRNPSIDVELS